ncbi:transcription initiation factor IIA subunit 2 [Hordeum vulgare]|nr:transcription initiation factor IIA subunit 2 [Hordeum vulgare]
METQREPTKAGAVVAPPGVASEPAGGGGGVLEHGRPAPAPATATVTATDAPPALATATAIASPVAPPGSATDRDAVLAKVEMERKLSMVKAWEENQKSKADSRRIVCCIFGEAIWPPSSSTGGPPSACASPRRYEMVSRDTLSPELAIQVLVQFDKSMTEALENQVKSKVTVKNSSIASLPVQALTSTINEENLPDLKYQFDTIDVDKGGPITALKKCSR